MNANWLGDWGRGDYSEHRGTFNNILDEDVYAQYNDLSYRSNGKKKKSSSERYQSWLRKRKSYLSPNQKELLFADKKFESHSYASHLKQYQDYVEHVENIGKKSVPSPSRLGKILNKKK